MTTYQLMLLRWLRMVEDNPHLDHRGTEPEPSPDSLWRDYPHVEPVLHLIACDGTGRMVNHLQAQAQRARAVREFYRLEK